MYEFDPALVTAILAIAGIGVTGLTEMIKRLFKASGYAAYIISFLVSAAATALTLAQAGSFAVLPFAIYTVIVFLEANGIYKFVKK